MVRARGNLGSSSSNSHGDDDNGRKSSGNRSKMFAKRTMGLKKKIFELTTLCGLDACMIVNGPNGELETWPENRAEVETIVQRYKNMNVEDRQKNNLDISSYVEDKKKKLETIRNENSSKLETLYPTWNEKIDELSGDSLREMLCSLESKLEEVKSRVKMMNREDLDQEKQNVSGFVKTEEFSAMADDGRDYPPLLLDFPMFNSQPQPLDTYIPSLVPLTKEFVDFNSFQQQQNHNFIPIEGGSMSSMYDPGFGTMVNYEPPLQQYAFMGDHQDGNYSTDSVSLPPLPPTTVYYHQPQPLQAWAPAAPSFQIEDDYFYSNMYSHDQQQQQDFVFMPINGEEPYSLPVPPN